MAVKRSTKFLQAWVLLLAAAIASGTVAPRLITGDFPFLGWALQAGTAIAFPVLGVFTYRAIDRAERAREEILLCSQVDIGFRAAFDLPKIERSDLLVLAQVKGDLPNLDRKQIVALFQDKE